ncbi:MAG: hypothetical protein RH862_14395 [Leptospiraceae bacterium]
MKRSNIIFLSIFSLNLAGLLLLFLSPCSMEPVQEPDQASSNYSDSYLAASEENTLPEVSEPEESKQPEQAELALYEMDLRILDIHNSAIELYRQRTTLIHELFQNQNVSNSLVPGSQPENQIAMHQRMDELQALASANELSRLEQIEFLELQVRKKKDQLAIQRRVAGLYSDQAHLGPEGDYKKHIKNLESEIQQLEEKLNRVQSSGYRID